MGGGAGLAAARGVAEGEEPAAVAAGREASSARVEGDAEGGALAASGQRRAARGAVGAERVVSEGVGGVAAGGR